MAPQQSTQELDRLRLIAIGRISRCADCARFRSLRAAHRGGRVWAGRLGAVSPACNHEVCAPLVARLTGITEERLAWQAAAGQG